RRRESSSASLFLCFVQLFHHSGLLSFPTRRSSDLALLRQFLRPSASRPHSVYVSVNWLKILELFRFGKPQCPRRLMNRNSSKILDRKSTRLNSSHEWISYAVFCLKKKKKT